jgi:predicted transposase YdaD
MLALEYDENIAKAIAREEGWEDGQVQLIERMILNGLQVEVISGATDMPLEKVINIKNRLAN